MLKVSGSLNTCFSDNKALKITGFLIFLYSVILYIATVAPTLSFWDCGEFITCSYFLGVPHPPGAPLFLLIGRLFTMIPFITDIGLRVNLLSVFSSAFTVLFLFLTTVKVIEEYRGKAENSVDRFINYSGAALAALAFSLTDSFWFNAVEAEVYALSMFLTSLVLWLAFVWLEDYKEYRSTRFLLFMVYLFGLAIGVHLLNLLIIPSVLMIIFFYDRRLLLRFDLWAFVPLLLIIGFSTYLMVFVRSGLNPVIDENNPENWRNFTTYLRREQYGDDPIFSMFTRKSPLWEYQVKKMYLRYFAWQYIGKGFERGADRFIVDNFSFRGLYGLPFITGLFGMFYHFRKDWKKALVLLMAFIITGVAIVIYLNQTDPQPRERDYVFVGSFYIFAIWIGTGVSGILELCKNLLKNKKDYLRPAFIAVTAVFVFVIPLNMLKFNYHEHDRSGLYLAWDYSYNILVSCDKDAILFTNGDNDTFPLWYLQFVEKIRTDVTVVNLALVNTPWYIKQMKTSFNMPVSFKDEEIDKILPVQWPEKQTVTFKFRRSMAARYMNIDIESLPEEKRSEVINMQFDIEPTLAGKAIRVQDRMILDILVANQWKRPVYFSVTVPVSNTIGLYKHYFRLDGMVYKVIPFRDNKPVWEILSTNIFEKYRYRNLTNTHVFYNFEKKDLMQNYRNAFLNLSILEFRENKKAKAAEILDKMEETIPHDFIPIKDYRVLDNMCIIYYNADQQDKYDEYASIMLNKYEIPDNKRYELASRFLMLNRHVEDALSSGIMLADKYPENALYIHFVLQSYEKLGNHKGEYEYLTGWLEKHPNRKEEFKPLLEEIKGKLK